MRIIVINSQVPFIKGGAEYLEENLVSELQLRGHQVESVKIPFKWYPIPSLKKSVSILYNLDLTELIGGEADLVICLKYPTYCIDHPRKVVWLCHQHREAYDLWSTMTKYIPDIKSRKNLKHFVKLTDNASLKSCRKVFTISKNVSLRLKKYNNIESEATYPPIRFKSFDDTIYYENFFFVPSRITRLKRQDLVLKAFKNINLNFNLIIAGPIDDKIYFEELNEYIIKNNLKKRVKILGNITDEKLVYFYKNCNSVIFIPIDEDYGLITLEAFVHSKAVISTTDSGGPTEFIENGKNGYLSEPKPQALYECLLKLTSRDNAINLGKYSREYFMKKNISWDTTIEKLLSVVK